MGLIENPKTYKGRELETIFFRPMFSAENAEQLGIRVLYNMPVPTTIQLWSPHNDILQEYTPGWNGGSSANRFQKQIELTKVKAEVGFSASEYFNQVYELITGRADVNLDDLTGSELEQAETEMFRAAIAESLRVSMWIGDVESDIYNKFDGLLVKILTDDDVVHIDFPSVEISPESILTILNRMWTESSPELKALKSEGNLVFLVTTNVYDAYEQYLDSCGADAAYNDLSTGRRELSFHGIKLIDMGISQYLPAERVDRGDYCILTDRRNLVMAVNTADYPGSEVRMWYNPDEMENRQRATFMVGCEIIDGNIVTLAEFA